jgi:hypothetical protein
MPVVKPDAKHALFPLDRRCGKDRRQREGPPPGGWERRRGIEPRKPEVIEMELTPSQWDLLHGDLPCPPAADPPVGR